MSRTQRRPAPRRLPWRSILLQGAILIAVVGLVWLLARNAAVSLARQGTATGFDFLSQPSPFGLSESVLSFAVGQSYMRAFLAGLSNTVTVAVLGIALATLLGFLVGFARLSQNRLLRQLASWYVEWMRNVPLILHLSLWYTIVTAGLPPLRAALQPVEGVFLSNRGLQMPRLLSDGSGGWALGGILAGLVLAGVWLRLQRAAPGAGKPAPRRSVRALQAGLIVVLTAALAQGIGGGQLGVEWPERSGLVIRGGLTASPELVVLVLGLGLYTSGFIAEIVRAGILSVPKGQTEAGLSMGLHSTGIMAWIVLPQALRVMLPPMTTQFSNLLKNSSLAVIIGYPDLVSVTNTSLNQTGQAIECIAIMMAMYLICSFVISGVMGAIEHRTRIISR